MSIPKFASSLTSATRDHKHRPPRQKPKRARFAPLAVLGGLLCVLGVMGFASLSTDVRAKIEPPDGAGGPLRTGPIIVPLELPSLEPDADTTEAVDAKEPPLTGHWQSVEVKRGDTLGAIFSALRLSHEVLLRVMSAGDQAKALARIHPGDKLQFEIAEDGQLLTLLHEETATSGLRVTRRPDGSFEEHQYQKPVVTRVAYASATISSSLYLAAQDVGLSDKVTMNLAEVFGWDIDFALDIRKGDGFTVLYEQVYLDGDLIEDGEIVAAEFVNQGRVVRAVRFVDKHDDTHYYTPEGLSMRKAFLRSPVDFRRVSSGFQRNRKHPITGKRRAHKGVDYAAATGTPIKASGDGKVVFAGTKNGYGRTVVLQHGGTYSTLYGHMSRIGKGIRNGARVRQGQTIGYVGQTGLATGPHLHYEFRVNDVHQNPLTVKLPEAKPIAEEYRAQFVALASELTPQLDAYRRVTIALNE